MRCHTAYQAQDASLKRAKISFEVLQSARLRVRDLAMRAGIDTDAEVDDYPHFHYLDENTTNLHNQKYAISGKHAKRFLHIALTSDVLALEEGESQTTTILAYDGEALTNGVLENAGDHYVLHMGQDAAHVATWLRSLSDNFVVFEEDDPYGKLPGPVYIEHLGATDVDTSEIGLCRKQSPFHRYSR